MADKRMFSKKVTDSDAFIELSSATQALYFHLNQGADDDGFNNQIQNAMFKAHASVDDLKVLLMKNFIIRFESGVIVIKHWRMHNYIRKDTYNPTQFQEELALLGINDNKTYELETYDESNPSTNRGRRLGKISIDKNSKDIFIHLPLLEEGQYHEVSIDKVNEYKRLYPNLDVEQELRSMYAWLDADPKRKKTKKGIARFINGWLQRSLNSKKSEDKKSEINKPSYTLEELP